MRVFDVAYVRFSAPDLEEMSRFLRDFGLSPFLVGDTLYARGAGPAPFLHVTEKGEAGFLALGLRANSVSELAALAAEEGTQMEPLDRPGGGQVVTLFDLDGFRIEIVAGQADAPGAALPEDAGWNSARAKSRFSATKRTGKAPSHVVRLGHCVLGVSDFRRSEQWYKDRFGFLTSDEISVSEDTSIGAFLRCDRGDTPTDHHSLFLLGGMGVRFHHAAFEVADVDDLFAGHERLKSSGWAPHWGIGRHYLGSQVFDYWRDPWGHVLEHWTDGDLFVASDGSRKASIDELRAVQWGHEAPHAS